MTFLAFFAGFLAGGLFSVLIAVYFERRNLPKADQSDLGKLIVFYREQERDAERRFKMRPEKFERDRARGEQRAYAAGASRLERFQAQVKANG